LYALPTAVRTDAMIYAFAIVVPPYIDYNAPRLSYSGGTPGSRNISGSGAPAKYSLFRRGAPEYPLRRTLVHAGSIRKVSSAAASLHQHELDAGLGLLLAAEGEERLALQIEQLLFGPFSSPGGRPRPSARRRSSGRFSRRAR